MRAVLLDEILKKIAELGKPKRGDIIVFKYPKDPSVDFIKRVIGIGGDVVQIHDGLVFVNGVKLDEPHPAATGS